ncbi:glutamic acid-rich protein isoform X1 [Hydra vulgaris]|uniref:glutamic acid-rich protein isoform X1 n=1 Tax=Hydra vulgaris TaxID=6087 RepID=UPI001F5EAAB8|nr:glutamic acid-rich protein isoform X1 [Hydra vulgaris]
MEFGNEEFETFEDDIYRDDFSTNSESDIEGYLYSQVHYASNLDIGTSLDNGFNLNESITEEYPEIQRSDYFVLGEKEKHKKEAVKPLFGANHWELDELDMLDNNDSQKNFKHVSRYYVTSSLPNIFCYNCDERGHLMRDCSKPKKIPTCYLCGGNHARHKCINDLCYNCMNPGHISKDCKEPRLSYQQTCLRCNFQGHTKKNCPEIWRQYHLTVEDGKIVKPNKYKTNKTRYCYNCASKKHFGEDCLKQRFSCRIYYSQFVVCYDKCSNTGIKSKSHKNNIITSEIKVDRSHKMNKQDSSHLTLCKNKSSENLKEEKLNKSHELYLETRLNGSMKSNSHDNSKLNINSNLDCNIKNSKTAQKEKVNEKEALGVSETKYMGENLYSKKCSEAKKKDRKRKHATENIEKDSESKKVKIHESEKEKNDKSLSKSKNKKKSKDDQIIKKKDRKIKEEKKEKRKEREQDRKENFKLFNAISSKVKKRKVENMWLNNEDTIPNEIRFSMLKEFGISCDNENTDDEVSKVPKKLNYSSFLSKIKEKGGIDFIKNEDFIPVGLASEEELRYTTTIKKFENKYNRRRNKKIEKKKQVSIEISSSGKKLSLTPSLDKVTLNNVRDIILYSDPEEEVDLRSQEAILRSNPEINISDEDVSYDHDLIKDKVFSKKSYHNGKLIGCLTQYNPNEVHQDHLVTYGLIKPTQDFKRDLIKNGSQKVFNLKSVDETKRVHKKWFRYGSSNKKNSQLNSSKNKIVFRGFQSFMTKK